MRNSSDPSSKLIEKSVKNKNEIERKAKKCERKIAHDTDNMHLSGYLLLCTHTNFDVGNSNFQFLY